MHERTPRTEEQKRNDRFSFIVGMIIALVILVGFVVFFR